MAKRLRDVCGMKENEEPWKIGRGFVVRDPRPSTNLHYSHPPPRPWTEKKLRELPPFEFENWAVIALGGRQNKAQVGGSPVRGASGTQERGSRKSISEVGN